MDGTPNIQETETSQPEIRECSGKPEPNIEDAEKEEDTSEKVVTLSSPSLTKGSAINNKIFDLFKKAKRIIVGADVISDGFFAIAKTEQTLAEIYKIPNVKIEENPTMEFSKFYTGTMFFELRGDPKTLNREIGRI